MSAFVYDIGDRVDPLGERVSDFSPTWVVMFVRMLRPLTYDRVAQRSRGTVGGESVQERGSPIILTDVQTVGVTRTKDAYVKSATVFLAPGEIDYLSQIHPGDWMFVWMLDNQTDGRALVDKLKDGDPGNYFLSGFKFMGKVNSRFKMGTRTPDGGPTVRFQITANAFKEFDASMYWDPYLANSSINSGINIWMAAFGIKINDFLSQNGIDVNRAIPTLVDLFLGPGVTKYVSNPLGGLTAQGVTGVTAAFLVPTTISKTLGKATDTAAGLWTILHGVQQYGGGPDPLWGPDSVPQSLDDNPVPGAANLAAPWVGLWPSSTEPMLGSFNPTVPDISGKTLWSLLSTYLNPILNEMFTVLKPGWDGAIVPTLVVRQNPFTTPLLDTPKPVTRFLDLPRWHIPPQMIQDFHIGSSDANRVNFVHLTPDCSAHVDGYAIQKALTNPASAPRRDDQDIQRSGLRPEIATVATSIQDMNSTTEGPTIWAQLRADVVMSQHLAFTGNITCFGIQEPISEGDNVEFDGIVFHIAGIVDTCTIDPAGKKHFSTVLQVFHGMAAAASDMTPGELGANQLALYAGIRPNTELVSFDTGRTIETLDSNRNSAAGFNREEFAEEEAAGAGVGDNTVMGDFSLSSGQVGS